MSRCPYDKVADCPFDEGCGNCPLDGGSYYHKYDAGSYDISLYNQEDSDYIRSDEEWDDI